MRVSLASERPTIIDLWRDSDPSPGEKPIEKILVETNGSYHAGRTATVVGERAHVASPRLRQFLVVKSSEADRLVAALKQGPVKVNEIRVGEVRIDLDRIGRGVDAFESVQRGDISREIFHSGSVGQVLSVNGRPVTR